MLGSKCDPKIRVQMYRSCFFYALLGSRSRDPSCHLRTALALELDPETLDLFGDFEPITSKHFSRTVEQLAR
jgi:hypothetical protein